ncbi:LysR family transcriptional regulator [Sulfurospirillum sp.]|nr:LysR family transcriptional regulator [Sulfurospirillum sp.]
MDSNILKIFATTAKCRSITLGAKTLGVTQANVTLRIKQLEKELGFELFHRVPKGIILTKEGEGLLPLAIDIEKKLTEIQTKMKNVHQQNSLSIASAYTNARIRLVPFIQKINNDFPNIRLEIIRETNISNIDALLNYKTDIAFIDYIPQNDQIVILKKFKNELLFLEQKNADTTDHTILSCGDNCQFYHGLKNYYKHLGITNYKVKKIADFEIILSCIEIGMGKFILPKAVVEKLGYIDKLKTTKIPCDVLEIPTLLVCRKGNEPKISKYLENIDID